MLIDLSERNLSMRSSFSSITEGSVSKHVMTVIVHSDLLSQIHVVRVRVGVTKLHAKMLLEDQTNAIYIIW
jgi:hypothetical protein